MAKKIKRHRKEEDIMEDQREKMKDAAEKLYKGDVKEGKGRSKQAYNFIKQSLESGDMDVKEIHYDEETVEKMWDAEIKKGLKRGKLKKADIKRDKLLRKVND